MIVIATTKSGPAVPRLALVFALLIVANNVLLAVLRDPATGTELAQ
jgi:hypothetical protein